MAHFTFIICPVAYFPILRCSKKPVLRFRLLRLAPRPLFPRPSRLIEIARQSPLSFHTTFCCRFFVFILILFFFFWHKSTNCKIQLKIVECKLISSLGYANYVATICVCVGMGVCVLRWAVWYIYKYSGEWAWTSYLGNVTKLFGCRLVCHLNWTELMALVVLTNW